MKMLLSLFAGLLLAATVASANPLPGIQVVNCIEEPPGTDIWVYDYFTCTGDFSANDLHIVLDPDEIAEGTIIMDCSVPNLPGYSCTFDATSATYYFPLKGPFSCVPGVSGQYLDIVIYTTDEFTRVLEQWTLDGAIIASFNTSITCPPVPTEDSAWGAVKSMYR